MDEPRYRARAPSGLSSPPLHEGRQVRRRFSMAAGGRQSGHSCFIVIVCEPVQPKPGRPTPRHNEWPCHSRARGRAGVGFGAVHSQWCRAHGWFSYLHIGRRESQGARARKAGRYRECFGFITEATWTGPPSARAAGWRGLCRHSSAAARVSGEGKREKRVLGRLNRRVSQGLCFYGLGGKALRGLCWSLRVQASPRGAMCF